MEMRSECYVVLSIEKLDERAQSLLVRLNR
jgi:hypothetical protein